ncbi:hypothetical protein ACTHHL_03780 [Aeribacillus composti]|uniref:hypothetical protein n=1 Tax=Aeribacillus composti TaxID=1868734 RepID=UPI00406A3BD5
MDKNKKWFEAFERKNYKNLYYVQRGHVYYDLLVLETETNFHTLPIPVFVEHYFNEKIDGSEINFGKEERFYIQHDYIKEPFQVLDGDEYYEMKEWKKKLNETQKFLSSITEEERKLLENLNYLVIQETENQYGKEIASDYIDGSIEGGFYRNTLACASSESLGLGICQCVNHKTFDTEPISAQEVLELAKKQKSTV